MKPRAIAGTIVWGESYVRNWLNYALPTYLAPGNFPEATRHLDMEFRLYTRKEDLNQLNQSSLGHRIAEIMPVKIYLIETLGEKPGVNITHEALHNGLVEDARREDAAVFYTPPDVLYINGTLGYIARSLASGNVIVMAQDYRVVTETITAELGQFSGTIPASEGRRLLLRHFSPLHSCYHPSGRHVPDHCEILIWPVKNEGLLIYNMSRDTGFFWPARIKFTPQMLPDKDNDFRKFDQVQSTELALGLSLTPVAQNINWLRKGKPFDPVRIAQFLLCFYTAYNDIRIRKPVIIPIVNSITPTVWIQAENEAIACFNKIGQCANAMAVNDPKFAYPPAPAPLPENDNPTDIDLCMEALEWLGPVIAQRFQQRVIAYLGELRRKYPGGDLPGYCSSWPTILPPRP